MNAQTPPKSGETFLLKFAGAIVDKRNLIFLIVIIGYIFSAFDLQRRRRRQEKLCRRHLRPDESGLNLRL